MPANLAANDAFPAHYAALRRQREGDAKAENDFDVGLAKAQQLPVREEAVGSSMTATIVNVTKNIIGSGLLALPVALHNASVLPGMVSLAVFAGIAGFSYALIGYCCAATGATTYHGLWSATVGSSSRWLVQGCILLDNCFTLWAYSTLVADFFGKAFLALAPGVAVLQSRAVILGVIGAFFFAPLCMARTLDALKYTSALGLLAILYSLLYVCGDYGVSGEGLESLAENLLSVRLVFFKSLALYAFAFLCHYSAPQVYSELADTSPRRFCQMTACSFSVVFVVFSLFAACGYGRWGAAVEGNVLKNYGEGSLAVLFMWVAMAFNVMFSYPLIFATFKENLYGILGTKESQLSFGNRLVLVVVGVGSTVSLGTVFEDASLVMGICGAVCSSAIEFIFPAMIYLNLPKDARRKGYGGSGALRAASHVLIAVGVLAAVVGTGATVADAL